MPDATTKGAINQRDRDFLLRRSWRPLTRPETLEYQQLLTAWTAADRAERVGREDVIEVA